MDLVYSLGVEVFLKFEWSGSHGRSVLARARSVGIGDDSLGIEFDEPYVPEPDLGKRYYDYKKKATEKIEIEKYKLGNPQSFRYLNQLNCYELVGVSDAHEYLATRRAMDITGITEAEQDSIFKVVAVIHHLGSRLPSIVSARARVAGAGAIS
ncbi:hypothetical protein IFM89_030244 [Coptis chinensis]|uniref:Myosin motor domain-containing protein n=1 Tax=Coptis chinensis TaxID=261450 RepID=A0A835HWD1_9MAGN|nr:hypothetical protein IFM89_030244 [Coptis chinensis]